MLPIQADSGDAIPHMRDSWAPRCLFFLKKTGPGSNFKETPGMPSVMIELKPTRLHPAEWRRGASSAAAFALDPQLSYIRDSDHEPPARTALCRAGSPQVTAAMGRGRAQITSFHPRPRIDNIWVSAVSRALSFFRS